LNAKWLNLLLVAVPATVVVWFLDRGDRGQLTGAIFALALVSLIPLARLIGTFTGRIEQYVGDRLGGLLGASFGNVPELAIGIALLVHAHLHVADTPVREADFNVIRGLVIGSVINNILFVLGSSIFVAALRNGRMRFSAGSAAGYASMLALAVVGLALPTLATSLSGEKSADAQVSVSIAFGVILIFSYVAYIAATIFNVGARGHGGEARGKERKEGTERGERKPAITVDGAAVLADDPRNVTEAEKLLRAEERDEDREERAARATRQALRQANPSGLPLALLGLGGVTAAIVLIAVILVGVTDNIIADTPLTPLSVGLIIFPIVCNLGEQVGAVLNAWQNRMEGAMAVAAGSSVQVALFVTPVLVLASLPISLGEPSLVLTMIFPALELIVLGLVSFVYALVSLDGETTWLEGLQLLAFYAMVAAVAFILPG
jgi:Ca2+:H+ antiporter